MTAIPTAIYYGTDTHVLTRREWLTCVFVCVFVDRVYLDPLTGLPRVLLHADLVKDATVGCVDDLVLSGGGGGEEGRAQGFKSESGSTWLVPFILKKAKGKQVLVQQVSKPGRLTRVPHLSSL
mmetsp:Transcript_18807/g.53929  ORF Transcript_18807/g.53929 Transcript_18807/m.53929 type:complete len:123 (-) Transcript_18807:6-374(-)